MKEFTINSNDAQTRLDKFISKAVPNLPGTLAQKYIRIKRIKVNGKRAERDTRLNCGDIVSMYINDEFFETSPTLPDYLTCKPNLSIIYEDENIMLLDKAPGLSVHEDEQQKQNTLIAQIKAYLYQNGEWNPDEENSFTPALCNRIDRNTGGIVIAAKNAPALRVLNEKIKNREIKKFYLCLVRGKLTPPTGKLENFLWKDAKKNQVFIRRDRVPGAKTAVTLYRTVKSSSELSLVECELITGRTHQIRAQMAHAGHPLLGDGKYGDNDWNKKHHRNKQALYSYRLIFSFSTDAGPLNYLKGAFFQVPHVDFAEKYFPSSSL